MKKLFALILAVVMICAMSVNVFAVHGNLVGNRPEAGNGTYEDGLAADQPFPTLNDYKVNITAAVGSVEHRYAVDITYDEMSFNVTGSKLVWNVNTLKYEVKDGGALLEDQVFDVTVTNYSDLGVILTVNVADGDAADSAIVAAYEDNSTTALTTGSISLDSAVAGTAVEFEFDVKVTADTANSKTWADVANYYAQYFTNNPTATSKTMGTMTLTLAKLAGATPSAPVTPPTP